MSIPTSGTYTFSVLGLRDHFIINGTSKQPYAIYDIGSGNNFTAYDVSVTFSGNTLTFVDSTGKTQTITYTSNYISGQGNYSSDSLIVQSSTDTSFYYYLSQEPVAQIKSRQTSLAQDSNSPGKWYFGDGSNKLYFDTSFSSTDSFPNTCFLPGTLILTPSGARCVEDLRVGDEVVRYDKNGSPHVDILTWVGKGEATTHQNLSDDEAGYPVRITKNAIADNVPFKDLLVTSEHCLFLDGQFIPVRMLVNGSSIHYDKSFSNYEYFHLETENHSIIMANGLLTESYLDTGNRNSFLQEGPIFFLGNPKENAKTWDNDAAAPLAVTRTFVEPVYRRIEARAKSIRNFVLPKPVALTDETNLHLKTENGEVIRPARQSGNRWIFMLPEYTRSVRIMSNASRPSETVGPFVDDRRRLGVLIGEISQFVKNEMVAITDHLQNETLHGWQNIENTPVRWTDGNALLPLSDNAPRKNSILSIQVVSSGRYLIAPEEMVQTIKAS